MDFTESMTQNPFLFVEIEVGSKVKRFEHRKEESEPFFFFGALCVGCLRVPSRELRHTSTQMAGENLNRTKNWLNRQQY